MSSAVGGNHYSEPNVITPDPLPAQLITAGHESCPIICFFLPVQHQWPTSQRCDHTSQRQTKPSLSLQLAQIADGTEQVFPVLSGFHALKDVVATVRRRRRGRSCLS